jgi:hypothetical protein
MPVYPIERLPASSAGIFTHLSKHDSAIWSRFLDVYADAFQSFAYDVALGGQQVAEQHGDAATRLGWQYSTALKIDVVGFRELDTWVIEVKPNAGTNAVGAALCYVELAQVDKISDLELTPVVVTDRMSPDVKFCAEQLGVLVFELPEPPPAFTRLDVGGAAEKTRREGLAG